MGVMRRLEWLARKRMQGTLTGKHTSPDKGFSVEFAEHREYTPGDDPRNLDWRVMAKSDRNVIKQGDGAGLVTFDSEVRSYLRSGSRPSQVRRILDTLYQSTPGAETKVADVLHEVAERVHKRGLVVLISDLFDDPKDIVEALHHFDFRQHELVIFHVLADEELTFPFKAFQRFRDLEGVEPMLRIDPQAVRAAYLERVREFVKSMEAASGNLRADYVPVNTKTPLRETLVRYLGRRLHAKR